MCLSDGNGVVSKKDEAVAVLTALGLPHYQQNERSGLTLLALAKLGPDDPWANVLRPLLRIWPGGPRGLLPWGSHGSVRALSGMRLFIS